MGEPRDVMRRKIAALKTQEAMWMISYFNPQAEKGILGGLRRGRHQIPAVLAVLLVSVVGLCTPVRLAAATGGEPFNGTFTAEAIRPPECTSPVGFCTRGVLVDKNGRPVATYDFTMLTNEPTGKGTEFRFTGQSLITKIGAPQGIMNGQDEGVVEFRPTGGSPFTTHVHVVGGTGVYDRAQGLITATGELDVVTGATAGTYTGTISRTN